MLEKLDEQYLVFYMHFINVSSDKLIHSMQSILCKSKTTVFLCNIIGFVA